MPTVGTIAQSPLLIHSRAKSRHQYGLHTSFTVSHLPCGRFALIGGHPTRRQNTENVQVGRARFRVSANLESDEGTRNVKRNLVIMGGRGCGKSSISRRLLATDKRFKLMSLDDLIVYEAQGSSIPEIVKDRGWAGFRDLEHEVVCKAALLPEWALIDAGGGVLVDLDQDGNEVYSERKARALQRSGLLVYIKRDIDYLIRRVEGDPNRPHLSATSSFRDIMQRREPFYMQAADLVIDESTSTRKKREVAQDILGWFYKQIGEEQCASKWYSVWDSVS